jgi:hypothetical protein
VRKVFGKEPNRTVNPDEGIAMGAAIQTGIIAGEVKELVLLDVTPTPWASRPRTGTFTPLIERNSTIPTRKSRVFTTVADNQTKVEVHVLQGESDMAGYNKSLAKFELTNIPPAPKGVPRSRSRSRSTSTASCPSARSTRPPAAASPWSSTLGRPQPERAGKLGERGRARASSRTSTRRSRKRVGAAARRPGDEHDALGAGPRGQAHADEQDRISPPWSGPRRRARRPDLEELKTRLAEMEKAASLIGQAMLRP